MKPQLVAYPVLGISGCVLLGVGFFGSGGGVTGILTIGLGGFLIALTKFIEPQELRGAEPRYVPTSIKLRSLFAIGFLVFLSWVFVMWPESAQFAFFLGFYVIAATLWAISLFKKWFRFREIEARKG